jgi:hypothetical protein
MKPSTLGIHSMLIFQALGTVVLARIVTALAIGVGIGTVTPVFSQRCKLVTMAVLGLGATILPPVCVILLKRVRYTH